MSLMAVRVARAAEGDYYIEQTAYDCTSTPGTYMAQSYTVTGGDWTVGVIDQQAQGTAIWDALHMRGTPDRT